LKETIRNDDKEEIHPDFANLYGAIDQDMKKCFEVGGTVTYFATEFKNTVETLITQI